MEAAVITALQSLQDMSAGSDKGHYDTPSERSNWKRNRVGQ